MKKLLFIALLSLTFVACGNSNKQSETTEEVKTDSIAPVVDSTNVETIEVDSI